MTTDPGYYWEGAREQCEENTNKRGTVWDTEILLFKMSRRRFSMNARIAGAALGEMSKAASPESPRSRAPETWRRCRYGQW